jgi:peptidoglycan-associated lipoprotein
VHDKGSVTALDSTGIGDIYFDFDQYSIRTDARSVLERNGQWIRNVSSKSLLIEGHCDERGTLAYNLVLGEKRAKSAKRYLENLGISPTRLHTTSYGEVKPACNEHNEDCWKYNRRAHFVVQ